MQHIHNRRPRRTPSLPASAKPPPARSFFTDVAKTASAMKSPPTRPSPAPESSPQSPMFGRPTDYKSKDRRCTTTTRGCAAKLLDLDRDLQGSRAIRLLATTNLSLYATLMERHLSDGAVPETELVVRLNATLKTSTTPSPASR